MDIGVGVCCALVVARVMRVMWLMGRIKMLQASDLGEERSGRVSGAR